MWNCTGFDGLTFTNLEDALFHQRAFPGHVVEEKNDREQVGVADFGTITLKGPDGRVKQVVELN